MSHRLLAGGILSAFLLAAVLGLAACKANNGSDAVAPGDETKSKKKVDLGEDAAGNPYLIGGYTQKGPFIIGSTVTILELGDALDPSGASFNTTTKNNQGNFSITSEVASSFVEIVTDGFYFDEVGDSLSGAPMTLRTISGFSEGAAINVNLLTQLARSRIKNLVLTGATFEEAQARAQKEVLAVFHINEEVDNFETLDLASPGTGNGVLLAVSAILQKAARGQGDSGGSTTAQLTALIAGIGADLEEDGVLDDELMLDDLRNAGLELDLQTIRKNLENRYANLGETINAPEFEKYTDDDGDGLVGVDEDNEPDPFDLGDEIADVDPGTTGLLSKEITLSGITGAVRVKLENGTLILDGTPVVPTKPADPEAGTPAITEAFAENKSTLQIELDAGDDFATTEVAVLRVGTAAAKFAVTTFALSDFPFTIPPINCLDGKLCQDPEVFSPFSNEITVTPIAHYLPVTLATKGAGRLWKNGKPLFATDPRAGITETTVVDGDKLQIELPPSPLPNNIVTALLTIGTKSATFVVSNIELLPIPVDLGADKNDVALKSVQVSKIVTIPTLVGPPFQPVSLGAGTLLINGKELASTTAFVVEGDTVQVKLTASGNFSTAVSTVLTIGATSSTFTVKTRAYPWSKGAALNLPRLNATGTVTTSGLLVVAGGFNPEKLWLDLTETLDPAGKPVWLPIKAVVPMTARQGAASAEFKDVVWAIGGLVDNGKFLDVTEGYVPGKATWITGARMPTPRESASAVTYNGRIYVMGGTTLLKDGTKMVLPIVESYDPGANVWSTKHSSMYVQRMGAAAVAYKDAIYIFGGTNEKGVVDSVEIYYPDKELWGHPLHMLIPVRFADAAEVNGLIYVIGGSDGKQTLDTVQVFVPGKNVWLETKKTPMPTPRQQAVGASFKGMIYVIGGSNDKEKVLGTVDIYNPALD